MEKFHKASLSEILTRPRWFAPLLLVLASALSYVYADRSMPIPDEGALLTAAAKILRGGVFYRDIDAYAFPGVSYLLAGAMSLFGEHLSVARGASGAIYCVVVLGVYACALTLVDQQRAALCGLTLLGLKFFAFPIFTMFFYADASLAAAIVALALFLRHPFEGASVRLFWVGVFAGLSITAKQSTGIYVALVFATVVVFPAFAQGPKRRGGRLVELASYGAGLLLVIGSISLYFASQGVFVDMIHGSLVRPFTGYLPTGGISFLPPLEWWRFGDLKSDGTVYFSQLYWEILLLRLLPGQAMQSLYLALGEFASRVLYSAIPIAFGACAWLWIVGFRKSGRDDDDTEHASESDDSVLATGRFFSAAGVSLAITASAFPRAEFIHVITIYPAVVLVLFALSRPSDLGRGWRDVPALARTDSGRRSRVESVFVALLLMTSIYLGARYDSVLTHRLSIERAEVWVKPGHAWLESLVGYVQEHVPEGAPLFVYGHEAHWYFLSDRYTPRSFSQVYPGMTGDETGVELAQLIRQTQPPVIVQGVLRWKGMPSVPEYTRELALAIRELYVPDPRAVRSPPNPVMLRVWRLRD